MGEMTSTTIRWLLVLLLISALPLGVSALTSTVEATDLRTGATTTYTITFTLDIGVPENGWLVVMFPEGYDLGAVDNALDITQTGYSGIPTFSVSDYEEDGYSYRAVKMSLDPSNAIDAGSTITITIRDVVNPSTPGTYMIRTGAWGEGLLLNWKYIYVNIGEGEGGTSSLGTAVGIIAAILLIVLVFYKTRRRR